MAAERSRTQNLPEPYCRRIFAGEQPLKVWREYRGLEQTDLRRETKIGVGRLDQIERGAGKPINSKEATALGRALGISANSLMPHASRYDGCGSLDVDEDAIISDSTEEEF